MDFYDLTEEGELVSYVTILESLAKERGAMMLRASEAVSTSDTTIQPPPPSTGAATTIRYTRFPIRDRSIPSRDTLDAIMQALAVSKQLNRKAAVHCWGGIGRTGTIVGCWLVYSGEVTDSVDAGSGVVETAGQRALEVLEQKWKGVDKSWRAPRSPENALQADMVRLFRPPNK